jgi:hypothetical protein
VQAAPAEAGLTLANWSWKIVRQFVQERFGQVLSRSSCLNYLHRLGFVPKRPKKQLAKAKAEKRAAFVATYVALCAEAQARGAKIFFVDEAHFRADVELRTKWVLRGEPALVATSNPKYGEKATYYSVVCLETGEVAAMSVAGNTNAATSVTFLQPLREQHPEPLIVIWDNGPAHHGPELRATLTNPGPELAAGRTAGLQPGLQSGRSHLGLDSRRCNGEYVFWHRGQGAGEGRRLLRRTGRARGRSPTALSSGLASPS